MKINRIHARQILDSRGNPTVEADVELEDGTLGRAAVPSGASTGINEALELRDQDKSKFGGKGVLKAIQNVNVEIQNKLLGMNALEQTVIDQTLIKLDGTENKGRLGANAILAVSLATAYAASNHLKKPLFQYINGLTTKKVKPLLPMPMMNILNGGKHANWVTDLQEFMIFPLKAETVSEALQIGTEVFIELAEVLKSKGYGVGVGDEGGYAPLVKAGNAEPLELMSEATEKAGYKVGTDVAFGLDGAASEFYKDGKYHLKSEGKVLSFEEMVEFITDLVSKYPIISLEDCLDQEDWSGWKLLTEKLGDKVQIVGDDLLVTNIKFLDKGIKEKAANAILIKLNQIGTLTETIQTVEMAHQAGWNAIISHRSGETEDTTIAHLSVGLATGQIKSGSLCRSERICKYNELMRIEEMLGNKAKYAGRKALFK